nr:head GIN domain-containing protein [Parachlamydia sp. AcF125]
MAYWKDILRGSGKVVTRSRPGSAFDHLIVKGPIDVFLTQGGEQPLIVAAEDNLIDDVLTEIKEGHLLVRLKKPFDWWEVSPAERIKVYTTTPSIASIHLKGPGDVFGKGQWQFKKLEIYIKGSGDVRMSLAGEELMACVKGSGDLNLDGAVKHQSVFISGSGEYKGRGLRSETAAVRIRGSGNAILSVEKELDVQISGSGHVQYRGNPALSSKVRGSGKIQKL